MQETFIGLVFIVVVLWLIDKIPSKKDPGIFEILHKKPRK